MRITVIGGTGLMGPTLVKLLLSLGHQVTCLNRRGASDDADAIRCDRRDEHALRTALEKSQPEVIIDMIPENGVEAHTLTQCVDDQPDLQLIAISSMSVYRAYAKIHRVESGPYQDCPIQEDDALSTLPVRADHHDKPAVERSYLNAFQNLTLLRLPAIYGWPDTSRIKPYVDAVFEGDGVVRMNPIYARWTHSRASVLDCAHAISLCLGITGQHIYNVGETTSFTESDWCHLVWEAAEKTGTLIEDSSEPVPFNADLEQQWICETTKIRRERGYTEVSDRLNVLRDTINRMRAA